MNKNRFLSGIICGFGAAVVSFIPFINILHCCRVTPTIAGFLGLLLFNKSQERNFEFKLKSQDALFIGFLAGLISSFFIAILQTVMIAITSGNQISEAIKLMEQYLTNVQMPAFIYSIEEDISNTRFSLILSLLIFFSEFIFNTIFTIAGALIFYSVNKNKKKNINNFNNQNL